jgi:methylmalonyl-CoA mutase cobalamin-binding domain/chain
MNSELYPDFQRYMTALYCQEPDRVPLGEWEIDRSLKEGFLGKKIESINDEIEFWLQAGFDYVPARSGIMDSPQGPKRISEEPSDIGSVQKNSRKWAMEHDGIIRNWEEFENFVWPSPDDFDLSKWSIFDKILPKGMKVIYVYGKILTPVWMYMGTETFYYALKDNEALIEALFEKVKKIQFEIFQRVVEHECVGAVLNNDDIAHNNGLMIHPQYLRKYVFPFYKKIGGICRDKGLGYIFHSDGDCTEAMTDIIDCGYHGFNPIQPNAMDIEEAKAKWGRKLCLIGNINLDSTLTTGTPGDVKAEVYERIRTIAPGGGYMVASSNSIPDYVPLENMKAMFKATLNYGKYPIDLKKGHVSGKISSFQTKPIGEKIEKHVEINIEKYAVLLMNQNHFEIKQMIDSEVDSGRSISDVISGSVIPAMTLIGRKYQQGEIYIPEMMISANTMSKILSEFKEKFIDTGNDKQGTVIIGTVNGDMHDIGKNLVSMMLEGQGFRVIDLGVSVNPIRFVQAVKENNADILGLSALLTTTMLEMKKTIKALVEAGLRDKVKIIIGGAPVTQEFADQIGADGYAYDAPGAAQKCQRLLANNA